MILQKVICQFILLVIIIECYRSWSTSEEETSNFGTNDTFVYTEISGNYFTSINGRKYKDNGGYIVNLDTNKNATELIEIIQNLEVIY